MIHVLATISLTPGTRAAFVEVFRKLVPHVQAEEGCIEYGAAVDEPTGLAVQDLAGDDTVIVVEKWEYLDALKSHMSAQHMTEYRSEVEGMVRGVSLTVLKPI
jgi:quinol monooxygenase YgiN